MSWRYRRLPSLAARRGDFAIRCVEEADIEAIRRWRNAQIELLRQTRPISASEQRRYFQTVIVPQLAETRPQTVLMTLLRFGKRIGYGGFVHCDWPSSRAEVSVLTTPRIAADRFAYREALLAFLAMVDEVAFDRLGLNRLCLETFDIREAHVQILEKAGFVREGRLRHHVTINGMLVDSLLHARLRSDRGQAERLPGLAPKPQVQAGGLTSSNPTRSIREPAGGRV